MENIIAEMSEYFSDPETDSFAISREEWRFLINELQTTNCNNDMNAIFNNVKRYTQSQVQ